MKISIGQKFKKKSDLIIAPFFTEYLKKTPSIYPKFIKNFVKDRVKADGFKAKSTENYHTFISEKEANSERLFIQGLGTKTKFDAKKARELGGEIGKTVRCLKKTKVSLILPGELMDFIGEMIEGMKLVQYDTAIQKSKKENNFHLTELEVITENDSKLLKEKIDRALLIAQSVQYVRDLVNKPANVVDSEFLAREAIRIAKENSYKKTILGRKELKKISAGGILSVNAGCERDPKLIILSYLGAKNKKEQPIVLVGKGVIFDTGGYNLKRSGSIETMHQDMAGGATVLGIMSAVKKLGIKKNIIAIIPVVENLINHLSYRPSDIITMLSGNTVEITNTDAEGRLILADAIHYAHQFKPEAIITIATLTGAAMVALGHRYSALVTNDQGLCSQVKKAGDEVDELGWELPIHGDYRKEMDSKVADFRNYDLGSGGGAGTAKAGAFLEKFVGENKWCHIDIGGTAFTTRPKKYETRGATAHGLRMLIRFLENQV